MTSALSTSAVALVVQVLLLLMLVSACIDAHASTSHAHVRRMGGWQSPVAAVPGSGLFVWHVVQAGKHGQALSFKTSEKV